MSEHSLVYITAKNKKEAQNIGKALVKEHLAACANIIDRMSSVYWWENKLQEDKEAILILKTKVSLVPELINKAKELHSYDCPCIISLPIEQGNPGFLDWIAKETR